ncbi:MAG: DNA polymerase/3'-5' exonuclease PolX [Alphaproteobacteria bacterium]
MAVRNADIAAVFDEIADLLEIEGANPFRIRAYRNAARFIGGLQRDVAAMVARGEDLEELPGIGHDLAAKIVEIVETGGAAALVKLRKRTPAGLVELLDVPGLGPKRVKTLYQDLDVHNLDQLHRAAKDGRIRALPGFGEKTERRILDHLETHRTAPSRFKRAAVAPVVDALIEHLAASPGVGRVVAAGSYRRAKETVGDVDILATAAKGSPVMERFTGYEEVETVVSAGPTRATVVLGSGLPVDLRVVREESYGSALHYLTGSKPHNIRIRRLGVERGLKINEYGVFRGERRIAGESEESVVCAVGLPFIPPELREDRGEIEAAAASRLPKLVELGDLKGDLHVHTKATDGRDTIREMAAAARTRGFSYVAVTEHSRHLTVAHGLDARRLRAQAEEIDRLNGERPGILILKGIEVDILEDGTLDLPDDALGHLDLVVGAVHSRFNLPRAKQTERIMRAMDRPHFTMLAHPSGRLIDSREPYDVDMPRLIRHARRRGCYLELNAHPERLDLLDVHCQLAKDEGVLVAINSDAHSTYDYDNLAFGVGQARRGWLEAKDVLNARPLAELSALLKRTM